MKNLDRDEIILANDTDGPIAAHPERMPVYSSAQIQERRLRILREARKMIAEKGIESFSIRALCKRADVAQRTLYNAFHNKDRIIALAIWHTYQEAHLDIQYRTDPCTMQGIVNRLIMVNRRNLRSPNYARAVMAIYFSPSTSNDIWEALREMVFLNQRRWLVRVRGEGLLQDWADVDEVAADLANLEYSVINDWAQGRLNETQYLFRLVKAFLNYAAGVTRGAERELACEMLRELAETGALPEF
jgi:AcrR family transcriptional regulator